MGEYLVEIVITGTDAVGAPELDRLRREESARAAELAADGTLLKLWRTDRPGWNNIGIWAGTSEEDVRRKIATLPMARFMTISCTGLSEHPSDPAPRAT